MVFLKVGVVSKISANWTPPRKILATPLIYSSPSFDALGSTFLGARGEGGPLQVALLLWPNTGLSGANTGRGRRGGVALPNTMCKCGHSFIFTMNPPPPFVLGCKSCYTLGHYITSILGRGHHYQYFRRGHHYQYFRRGHYITSILEEGTTTSILGEGTILPVF